MKKSVILIVLFLVFSCSNNNISRSLDSVNGPESVESISIENPDIKNERGLYINRNNEI
jgi:hypothetical protein